MTHSADESARRHCQYAPAPSWLPFSDEIVLEGPSALPTEAYDERLVRERTGTNQHMGQRKLLISEVHMLTTWYAENDAHPLVVYVGAAPGSHDVFLHRLFPHVRFVLYDGARFDDRLHGLPGVFELRREYFTDAHCAELLRRTAPGAPGPLAGKPMLFVCDMRSDAKDHEHFEAQVMRDMVSQRRWAEVLRPELSLLKFRLPYTVGAGKKVPYLRGRLVFGVWPPEDSGETRLLVRKADLGPGAPETEYDFTTYEGVKTFHNHYTRKVCFADAVPPELAHLVFGPNNLYCSCYDCLSELVTYKKYLEVAHERAFKSPLGGPQPERINSVEEIVRMYAGPGREPEFPMGKHRPPPAVSSPLGRLPSRGRAP